MRQLAMTYSIALDTVPINHVSRNYHVEVCLISSFFVYLLCFNILTEKCRAKKKGPGS